MKIKWRKKKYNVNSKSDGVTFGVDIFTQINCGCNNTLESKEKYVNIFNFIFIFALKKK